MLVDNRLVCVILASVNGKDVDVFTNVGDVVWDVTAAVAADVSADVDSTTAQHSTITVGNVLTVDSLLLETKANCSPSSLSLS